MIYVAHLFLKRFWRKDIFIITESLIFAVADHHYYSRSWFSEVPRLSLYSFEENNSDTIEMKLTGIITALI